MKIIKLLMFNLPIQVTTTKKTKIVNLKLAGGHDLAQFTLPSADYMSSSSHDWNKSCRTSTDEMNERKKLALPS